LTLAILCVILCYLPVIFMLILWNNEDEK